MNCKIEQSKLSGVITCPTNKSYTHRAIFLASLVNGKSLIKNVLRSRDTNATIEICKSLGAEITEAGSNLKVKGISKFEGDEITVDASNSGTTIRIAAAIASLRDSKTILTGDESLRKRPMKPLLDALETLGAKCSSNDGKPPLEITGKIKGGEISIAGNVSSQFISALFIASPLTELGTTIKISSNWYQNHILMPPYHDEKIWC